MSCGAPVPFGQASARERSASGAFAVTYDAALVEEAVLLAEPTAGAAQRARFRWERDRLYEVRDVADREARFEELHGRWFVALGLDRSLHEALAEKPLLLRRTRACRVARTVRDELADLAPADPDGAGPPAILVRLRPESFLDPARLLTLLRHELEHVSDMVDPGFGYERELPGAGAGPAHDALVRERYRAAWDASIDGRLFRRGALGPSERETRRRDFARAFPVLGDALEAQFRRWFDDAAPTHRAILAFALSPPGLGGTPGRCPVCALPAQDLDPHPERLPAAVLGEVVRSRPGWRPEDGLCGRCAELFEARQPRG
jgi:hypothetical protein